MTDLERRYRRLLGAYPAAYRKARGDEMLTTLLDAARPAQRRPAICEAASIVSTGWTVRLRTSQEWGGGLRIAALVALTLVTAVSLLPFLQPQSYAAMSSGDTTATVAVFAAVVVGAWHGRRQWLLLVPAGAALFTGLHAWQLRSQRAATSPVLWTAPTVAVMALIVLSAASARASSAKRVGAIGCGLMLAVALAGRVLPPGSSAGTREVHQAMHWLSLQWISPSANGYWLDLVIIGLVVGLIRLRVAYAVAWLSIPIAVYFQPRPVLTTTPALLAQAGGAALVLVVIAAARPLRRPTTPNSRL